MALARQLTSQAIRESVQCALTELIYGGSDLTQDSILLEAHGIFETRGSHPFGDARTLLRANEFRRRRADRLTAVVLNLKSQGRLDEAKRLLRRLSDLTEMMHEVRILARRQLGRLRFATGPQKGVQWKSSVIAPWRPTEGEASDV